MIKDFLIADFRLRIEGENLGSAFGHFGRALRIFEVPIEREAEVVLWFHPDRSEAPDFEAFQLLDEFDFPEVNAWCRLKKNEAGYLFTMTIPDQTPLWLYKAHGSAEVQCNLEACRDQADLPSLLRFGLWTMFGLAITPRHAIAIHSSTITCAEGAALFLGESGTGKSTHTGLWLEYIPGAQRLNDDSPIIRMREGVATVYGSPWSGKSPCYKQERWPILGLVRLSQAPHNRMRRLGVIQAIGALLPSCPPSFAFDGELQDAICETLSEIINHAPVYHLECLPDAAAAQLSHQTLKAYAATRR
ncbi:MAG: hypothetical protein IJX56_01305 [Alistipes sp.]|nr:hypothetical protein [Alistipes sp.]